MNDGDAGEPGSTNICECVMCAGVYFSGTAYTLRLHNQTINVPGISLFFMHTIPWPVFENRYKYWFRKPYIHESGEEHIQSSALCLLTVFCLWLYRVYWGIQLAKASTKSWSQGATMFFDKMGCKMESNRIKKQMCKMAKMENTVTNLLC